MIIIVSGSISRPLTSAVSKQMTNNHERLSSGFFSSRCARRAACRDATSVVFSDREPVSQHGETRQANCLKATAAGRWQKKVQLLSPVCTCIASARRKPAGLRPLVRHPLVPGELVVNLRQPADAAARIPSLRPSLRQLAVQAHGHMEALLYC